MSESKHNEIVLFASLMRSAGALLRWWREELVSLLPAALRHRLQYREHQLVVDFSADGVRCADCHLGLAVSETELFPDEQGALSEEDTQHLALLRKRSGDNAVIRLAHDHVLSVSFPLPQEAEKNLHEVVGYELGRYTPFKIEQAYYDYEVLERRRDEKKILLAVSAVPRAQIEPFLSMVRAWGLVPSVLTVSSQPDEPDKLCHLAAINLLPPAEQGATAGARSNLVRLLLVSASLLLVATFSYPLLLQEMRITELQAKVAAVKADAVSVQVMKQELETAAAESAFVDEKKRHYPDVLELLNVLTVLLPDDTWLEHFEMKEGRVRLQGLSADASSLIELLENSPVLQKVTFDSPIVKDPRLDRYRFQIVAEVVAEEDGG